MTSTVTWTFTAQDDDPAKAVQEAWESVRSAGSIGTYFTVVNDQTKLGVSRDFYQEIYHARHGNNDISATEMVDQRPLWEQMGFDDVWAEHPVYTRDDWQNEVSAGDTNHGYWDWVEASMEADGVYPKPEPNLVRHVRAFVYENPYFDLSLTWQDVFDNAHQMNRAPTMEEFQTAYQSCVEKNQVSHEAQSRLTFWFGDTFPPSGQ